jgi:hypothetical protein
MNFIKMGSQLLTQVAALADAVINETEYKRRP